MNDVLTESFTALFEQALGNVRAEPKNLAKAVQFVANYNNVTIEKPLSQLVSHLTKCGPNDGIRHALTLKLQQWDHEEHVTWSEGTEPHSEERREDALRLLGFEANQFAAVNETIPRFTEIEVPIVIAEQHKPWYEARRPLIRDFYWSHYVRQLKAQKGSWDSDAIAALNLSTDDVIARLSDPTRPEIYQVKGLVMGYVQSGKTSHFSGLIAKAVDVGYRLIVVLGGTMDILRQQTQRRIDKDIVGQELLGPDEYGQDVDWPQFVQHEGVPSEIGFFDWERLTGRDNDYTALQQHLRVLEFRAPYKGKPYNDPANLLPASAKLAVIKKTPIRMSRLCDDLERLKKLRNALEHVPTLIIDDESDQASINTVSRSATSGRRTGRTSTNLTIGRLLRLLPRAQYVGYTATPFANVFIDPEDADDLFPKDFIVSLPRPRGYMGVADFYDFDNSFEETDVRNNRRAFVRAVDGPNDDSRNLPSAIDAFVLAGAIKLFRQHASPETYNFRHHTMLIHHSARKVVHDDEANEVRAMFGGGARYMRVSGMQKLESMFDSDFAPISRVRAPSDPLPRTFKELKPFINECISRICDGKPVLIVNGDNTDDTPDFDQRPVWAILVGGAKLSRGYTVEGLTTSYYRRPAGAADTLMQMGRWFGFRSGYRDLVRLYIGRNERRGKTNIDLYEAFGAVCRDEEALRADLLKYKNDGLTPKQVPPLVHQHLPALPPTSRNKMFNAQIAHRDFAGDWTEKTSAPVKPADMKHNFGIAHKLLAALTAAGHHAFSLTNASGTKRRFDAYAGIASADVVVHFLNRYRWSEGKRSVQLEMDYIQKQLSKGRMKTWLVLLPQVEAGKATRDVETPIGTSSVIQRSRVSETRFGVYDEPRHRDVAKFLTGVQTGTNASEFLRKHVDTNRPVLVLYFVEEIGKSQSGLSIGFGIQFPGTRTSNTLIWTVADPAQRAAVVVQRNSK